MGRRHVSRESVWTMAHICLLGHSDKNEKPCKHAVGQDIFSLIDQNDHHRVVLRLPAATTEDERD